MRGHVVGTPEKVLGGWSSGRKEPSSVEAEQSSLEDHYLRSENSALPRITVESHSEEVGPPQE